jgi:uncharacterized membrane protein YvbJ
MGDLIAEILILIEELKFWKKKKKRRKFEKEKNLPKKTMVNPTIKILVIGLILILVYRLYLGTNYDYREEALIKINDVKKRLEENKEYKGKYPKNLDDIKRGNPLLSKIDIDPWGNKFHYKTINDGRKFILISLGPDGKLNTNDDISD